ncbi:MAG TPA: ECF transporter S component [Firmicutes bacterium]|nr:ECF transporter S component [Candidatus Fermentithermobacillaceae bacterium]
MKFSTRQVVVAGLLGSLTVALGLMPVGGFIPVPTPAGSATTMHLPTILAGILEGPVVGGLVGAIFGAFSFYRAQVQPNPIAKLIFSNPLIAFGPRILIGVAAYWAFQVAERRWGRVFLALAGGGVLGYTAYWASFRIGGMDAAAGPWRAALAAIVGLSVAWGLWVIGGRQKGGAPLAALVGTMTNTVGVLGLAVAFGYVPLPAALAVAVLHGIPEALVAMVLVTLVHSGVQAATPSRARS